MRNFKAILAYDGTDFFGWQFQPGKATIQAALRDSLFEITGEYVLPQGSGRTDAGVHALGQVASFSLQSPIPAENLTRALNHRLPLAIRVLTVEECAPKFHARHSAAAKIYRYRIYRKEICPPFVARYVLHHPFPLNEAAMIEAAPVVAGEHDFTSFAAVDAEVREAPGPQSNIRRILSSALSRDGDELVYEVCGNGFLHHMVRNIVGTLLWIGKNHRPTAEMRRILAAQDRRAAAATAPPHGLYLVRVEY